MPLKVVMLLGSEGIPGFFPQALLRYDRDTLIISLVILSNAFYFVSLIFGKISKQSAERGARRLIANTQKIIIFENQDNLASNAYTKYTDALAGLIFALVTIGLFSIFYPDVAALTVIFLLLTYLITDVLYSLSSKLENTIHKKPNAVTNTISNIGFLLIFLYIVVDFLYLSPPEFIIALATIIISRLMLSRLSITAAYLFSLKKDEGKINALFFHHHAFLPVDIKQHQSAWDLLDGDILLNWLRPMLEEAAQQKLGDISVQWKQTQLNNIVVLQAETSDKTFLIKLFEDKISSQARHESTLFVDIVDSYFPCPPFLIATKVENYHCHVFDITRHEFLSQKEAIKFYHEINGQLLKAIPPEELIERYRRSKAFLWERIDSKMIARLNLVAQKDEKSVIREFEKAADEIKMVLQSLPLSIAIKRTNNTALMRSPKNQIVSLHWPNWIIEPSGYGILPMADLDIFSVIQAASQVRSELKDIPVERFEIASFLASCEQAYNQNQYNDSIELLKLAINRLR